MIAAPKDVSVASPTSCYAVRASSLACFSASAYVPALHRQFYAVHAESQASFLDEFLVRDPSAWSLLDETVEPVERMTLHIAIVQAEGELVNVPIQMLRAYLMINAVDSALHDCPHGFDAVGAHLAAHVFASAVIHGIVFETGRIHVFVSAVVVGIQRRSGRDVVVYLLLQAGGIGSRNGIGDRAAIAFTHSNDSGLTDGAATSIQLLTGVLVLFLATDIGLIDFNDARQDGKVVAAGFAEPLKNEPSGLLRDADFLGQLHRGNALARSDEQVHCINPLVKRDMRALENGPSANGEIFGALVAAVVTGHLAHRDPITQSTYWAMRAFGPEPGFQIQASAVLIGKHLKQLEGADGYVVIHGGFLKVWRILA